MAADAPVSPLAPKTFAELPAIDGVRLATGAANIRYAGRTDVLLAVFDEGRYGRRRVHQVEMPFGAGRLVPEKLPHGKARALVVNSGNANAFTGKVGKAATELIAETGGEGDRRSTKTKFFSASPA